MVDSNIISDDKPISFGLKGKNKAFNLTKYKAASESNSLKNQGNYDSLNSNRTILPKFLRSSQNNFYVISCVVLCLNAGITFVADFRREIRDKMGYPEILMKQLTTIGAASSAFVGFTLDSILYRISLKTAVIVNTTLLSLSYLLFRCFLSIENANQLTGATYVFLTIAVLITWVFMNYFAGANFYLSLKTARIYTKENRTSTIIGLVSCSYSLSISFISLIHDSLIRRIADFFGVLSLVNFLSISIHILYHKAPYWYMKEEKENKNQMVHTEDGMVVNRHKMNNLRTRVDSCLFASTSSVFDKSVLSNNVTTMTETNRGRSKSIMFSNVKNDSDSNATFVFKEIPMKTFFEELFTFNGFVCYTTVFLCIGILNNIYFVLREISNLVQFTIGTYEVGTPEFISGSKELASSYGKVISITSAFGRLFSGMILDYMYKKQYVLSPFPMVIVYTAILFTTNLFAAISPFWAAKTTILQISFGIAGGMYGILPVILGVLFSVDKLNKMIGFADFCTTIGVFVFGNMTNLIGLTFGNEYRLNIYFGVSCICMMVLAVLNYVLKQRVNKDSLNK